MLQPGSRLAHYDIVGSLGAGGMGEVYRARAGRLERTVAIKILSSHLASKKQALERFRREARANAWRFSGLSRRTISVCPRDSTNADGSMRKYAGWSRA